MDHKLEFLKRMREEMKKVYAGEKSVEEIKEMIRQENGGSSSEKESKQLPARNRGLVLIEEED